MQTCSIGPIKRLRTKRELISPLITLLPWRNGSVFGTTPVALKTKSQPNVLPLVSWMYTGQDPPERREKLEEWKVGGKKGELGKVQIRAACLVLTILRSECLLWGIEQLLRGEDLFHLTLVFQRNSAGHLRSHQQGEETQEKRRKVWHNRRSRQIQIYL